MKKTILLCFVLGMMLTGYSQYLKPKSEFVLNDRMYEVFSKADIEKMYNDDFENLFRQNFKMSYFARVAGKSVENGQMLGYIEDYAKPGVVVDEARIIREGGLNPFDFSFPQDENQTNVIRMHTPDHFVVILSKRDYAEMEQANLKQFDY